MAANVVFNRVPNFNITSFTSGDHGAEKENLAQTGRYDLFFDQLNSWEDEESPPFTEDVITILFQNLSLVLSTQGSYKGEGCN